MESSLLFAVPVFAFIMSVTPGPNNMMLLASGAQFGYRNTLPHMFGIILGVALLISSVLVGLGLVFELYPVLYDLLKILGSVYLLWLALKIATASTDETRITGQEHDSRKTPMKLQSAVLFQFINPKAWAMAIGAVSTFTLPGEQYVQSGLWIMSAFACMGFIAISIWAYLGVAIRQLLTTRTSKRNFNWAMGLCTAATLLLIIFD
jgi:threonine/homoserine/homoserine lactone efflux protein